MFSPNANRFHSLIQIKDVLRRVRRVSSIGTDCMSLTLPLWRALVTSSVLGYCTMAMRAFEAALCLATRLLGPRPWWHWLLTCDTAKRNTH